MLSSHPLGASDNLASQSPGYLLGPDTPGSPAGSTASTAMSPEVTRCLEQFADRLARMREDVLRVGAAPCLCAADASAACRDWALACCVGASGAIVMLAGRAFRSLQHCLFGSVTAECDRKTEQAVLNQVFGRLLLIAPCHCSQAVSARCSLASQAS